MVSYYAAQFFIALSVVNSTFVLSPTNSTGVASSNDEKNRNFHVKRTLSEGNLTTNSRVHGKIKDDADLKKNRNDDFHLNGTDTDSVQDWNRSNQTFMFTVISSAAFCLCLCLQLSIVCIFMFTQQPLCLQLFIILQQHFIVCSMPFHHTSTHWKICHTMTCNVHGCNQSWISLLPTHIEKNIQHMCIYNPRDLHAHYYT